MRGRAVDWMRVCGRVVMARCLALVLAGGFLTGVLGTAAFGQPPAAHSQPGGTAGTPAAAHAGGTSSTPVAGSTTPGAVAPNAAVPGAAVPGGAGKPPTANARPADWFPPVPKGFYRGSNPNVPGDAGFYYHWFPLGLILGTFAAWLALCRWVDEDARQLKNRSDLWNTAMLLCGVGAITGGLCAPSFLLGFVILLGGIALPTALYVNERNRRVPDDAKVLTPAHIRKVLLRVGAHMGLKLVSKQAREAIGGPPIRFIGKSKPGEGNVDRTRQVESSKGYLAAKELVYDAIVRGATDIHLEPKEGELAIRLRIDGTMQSAEPFERGTGDAIINIFKVLSAMDITERRKPQDGSFRAELQEREVDFRVATQGVQQGEKMSLRILDQSSAATRTLAALGMRKQLLEQLQGLISQPHGLFLSCGPTGAGKSTTLYAALKEIDPYENNIITIEDPVEYKMANVTQIEINTKAGQTFGGSLRSVLRQDPDVVMVGEIRDGETAKIACQAANTGHMVFSTIHANDTFTALARLIDLGVEPFQLADSISAIVGQRLLRKLCQECRQPYKPDADTLRKLELPAEKIKDPFYKAPDKNEDNQCPACGGSGYSGRTGVYELLVISDRIRDLLRDDPNLSNIKAEARKSGMLYMREEGLRLVLRGQTSLDELLRVVK